MKNADMPAYPTMLKAGDMAKSEGGLTKREYFAAMAMQGLMYSTKGHWQDDAQMAAQAADALLAELERTK